MKQFFFETALRDQEPETKPLTRIREFFTMKTGSNFQKDRSIKGMLTTSHALLTMLIFIMAAFILGGCVQGEIGDPPKPVPTTTPTSSVPTTKSSLEPTEPAVTDIKFELPDSWEWGEDGSPIIWSKKYPESPQPLNKIEFMGMEDWTEVQAKEWVWQDYQYNKSGCDYSISHGTPEDCEYLPEYKELTIAGTKVYVSMDVNYAWGTPDWASRFAFYKNGEVVRFDIQSRADQSTKEIARIINTITWKKLKK